MILPFSTQLNGKPTYFVEKILRGLLNEHSHKGLNIAESIYQSGEALNYQGLDDIFTIIEHKVKPKLHTIRDDKNDRWKPGTKIDFFINCRQPNMFRFAPVLPVVSTQKVEIKWIGFNNGFRPCIWIDKKLIYDVAGINKKQMLELAQNDGFDTIEDFFRYFDKDFNGKIIHWTDLKY
ncbi:hypothetical protein [Flavobacterium sp.]|uniref:hypothetical protein n=1 Tax=Flavobacterium sp. TaxID=239 RepID=UPI0026044A76|nr:hypothetical protein [Flavobacterium sp.]